MEITIKVAMEDLEKSIKRRYSKKLDGFEDNNENKNLQRLLAEYIRNNLRLSVDKNTKEFQWVGKELGENLHDIYLYFEIPNYDKKENVESIIIKNTLFLDLNYYQTNIVLLELKEKKYNLTFSIDNDIQTIFINNKIW